MGIPSRTTLRTMSGAEASAHKPFHPGHATCTLPLDACARTGPFHRVQSAFPASTGIEQTVPGPHAPRMRLRQAPKLEARADQRCGFRHKGRWGGGGGSGPTRHHQPWARRAMSDLKWRHMKGGRAVEWGSTARRGVGWYRGARVGWSPLRARKPPAPRDRPPEATASVGPDDGSRGTEARTGSCP